MNIDEAMALAESDQYAPDPVVGVLASEVERLRSTMRPATCRHDPGCGSELACIARGQAESNSYREQAQNDAQRGERALLERGVLALERLADRPEVRWVDADKKLSRIKTALLDHSCECPGEWPGCLFCKLRQVLDSHSP